MPFFLWNPKFRRLTLSLLLAALFLPTAFATQVVVPVDPNSPQVLSAFNTLLIRLSNYADMGALEEAQKFLNQYPTHPQNQNLVDNMANRYRMQGQTIEGAAVIAAFGRKAKNSWSLFRAARLIMDVPPGMPRDNLKALAYFQESIALEKPGSQIFNDASLQAGSLHLEMGNPDEGLSILKNLADGAKGNEHLRQRSLEKIVKTLLELRLQQDAKAYVTRQMKDFGDLPAILAYSDVMTQTGSPSFSFLQKQKKNYLSRTDFALRYLKAAEFADELSPEIDRLIKESPTQELVAIQQALSQMERTLEQLRVTEAILEKEPNHIGFLQQAANLYLASQFYQDAQRILTRLLQIAPNPDTWRLQARVATALGQTELADQAYEKAAVFVPGNPGSYERLAQIRMEDQDLTGSIAVFQKGREVLNLPTAFAIPLARVLELNLQTESAMTEYINALSDPPLMGTALQRLKELLTNNPDLKPLFEETLTKTKLDAKTKFRLQLEFALWSRNLESGLSAAKAMQALEPNRDMLLDLAGLHLNGGFPEFSEALLEERLKQPNPPTAAILSQARLKERLSKPQESLALYETVLSSSPTTSQSKETLHAGLEYALLLGKTGAPLGKVEEALRPWMDGLATDTSLYLLPVDLAEDLLDLLLSLGKADHANGLLAANVAIPKTHRDWAQGFLSFLSGNEEEAITHLLAVGGEGRSDFGNDAIRLIALIQYADEVLKNPSLVEGIRYYHGGRYEDALTALTNIKQADPFSLLYQGLSLERLGRKVEAAELLGSSAFMVNAVFGPMMLFEAARILKTENPKDTRIFDWVSKIHEDYPNNIYKKRATDLLLTPTP